MSLLGSKVDNSSDWFVDSLRKKVEIDLPTSFLDVPWMRHIPLRVKFSMFFSIFSQQDRLVGKVDLCEDIIWVWDLRWRRSYFV